MWFIFLVSCIVVALAALVVIWIGSKIFRSIERQERKSDLEEVAHERAVKKLREEMEKEE